ncbi:uncharacterized protein METZ01_LOCUS131313 [marine metagenome]|uniref:Uncharacterized protein n=1 Tax=marine metagenome TaxID=408172 RepID=A0A381YND6_9ZZZZ
MIWRNIGEYRRNRNVEVLRVEASGRTDLISFDGLRC